MFTTFGAIFLEAFGWLDPTVKLVESLIRKLRILLGIQKEQLAQAKVAQELARAASALGDITLETSIFGDTIISGKQLQGGVEEAIKQGATGSAEEFASAIIKDLPPALQRRMTPQARQQIESIFTDLFGDIQGLGPEALQGISEFAEATGRTLKSVTNQLETSQGALRFEGAEKLPGYYGEVFATFKDTRKLEDEELEVAKQFNAAQINRLQSQEILVNLQEALVSGSAEAEQIEKRRSAVIAKITNLKESENAADRAQVGALQETLNLLDQEAQAQLAILGERDKILKTFSTQIKASEKLADLFVLVGEGESLRAELAEDANAKQRNRNKLLLEDFELGKNALARQRAGLEVTGRQGQLATLARDAQKAILGVFVQTVDEAKKLAEQQEKIAKQLEKQKQAAENQLAIVQAQRDLELVRQQESRNNKDLDRTKKILEANIKLRKVQMEGAEAQRKAGQNLERELANQTFQTDESRRALELKFAKEDLDALKAFSAAERTAIEQRAAVEEKKLQNTIKSLETQLGSGEGSIQAVYAAREKAETDAINAQRQLKLDEIDLLAERKKGILEEGIEFQKHIQGIADVLAADVVARKELLEGDQFVQKTVDALRKGGREQEAFMLERSGSVGDARRLRVGLEQDPAAAEAQNTIKALTDRLAAVDFNSLKASTNAAFDAEQELSDLRRGIAQNNEVLKAEEKLKDVQTALAELGILTEAELTAVNNALMQATTEYKNLADITAGANDRMKAALKESQEIIEGGLISGFQEFNTALIEGNLTFKGITRGFKDMLGNMLKEIQSAVFTKTIAEPIAGSIATFLPKLFAAGGLVHMAAGGMKRDRVPAMLEPGEFVIRKEAAKKLGMSKLAEMNAGIEPDPLAMLIARFSGSKVRGMQTGGAFSGVGFNKETADALAGFDTKSGKGASKVAFGTVLGLALKGTPVGMALTALGVVKKASDLSKIGQIKDAGGSSSGTTTTDITKEEIESQIAASRATGTVIGTSISPNAIRDGGFPQGMSFSSSGSGGGFTASQLGGSFSDTATGKFSGGDRGNGLDGGSVGAGGSTAGHSGDLGHKFAAGGLVRDRVPAMLEPGEFVIRKPMAKAIGGAVLSQMNSTGKPPEVSVNVNNTGAPKDVTTKPPKMNGNKVIIDLITKDLKNNGAIKKSLRKK